MSEPPVKQPSAVDPEVIAQMLPSPEEEAREAARLESIFHSASRRGAGLITGSGPILRPHGQAVYDAFHEMIGTGRIKQRAPLFTEPIAGKAKNRTTDGVPVLKIMLPRNFCPICDRTNRPHEGGAMNMTHYDRDMPHLGVKAFQAVIYFFCQECTLKRKAEKESADAGLLGPDGTPITVMKNDDFLTMIRRRVEQFILATRDSDLTGGWRNKEAE